MQLTATSLRHLATTHPDLVSEVVQRLRESDSEASPDALNELDQLAQLMKQANLIRQLVERRVERGLTQQEIARRMGTSQSAIARIEGCLQEPRLNTAQRYGQLLGLDLRFIEVDEPAGDPNRSRSRNSPSSAAA